MSSMLLYGQVQTKTSTRASLLCLFFDRLLFPRAGHSEQLGRLRQSVKSVLRSVLHLSFTLADSVSVLACFLFVDPCELCCCFSSLSLGTCFPLVVAVSGKLSFEYELAG